MGFERNGSLAGNGTLVFRSDQQSSRNLEAEVSTIRWLLGKFNLNSKES